MKYLICLFLFTVTWNEYVLVPYYKKSDAAVVIMNSDYYTVVIATGTQILGTEDDVRRFTGYGKPDRDGDRSFDEPHRMLNNRAFNIGIEEKE